MKPNSPKNPLFILKKRSFWIFLPVFVFFQILFASPSFAVSAEHAAGVDSHAFNLNRDLLFPYFNFFLLVALLVFLLRKPLREFLISRAESSSKKMDHLASEKQKLVLVLAQYDARLQQIDQAVQQKIALMEKEAQIVCKSLLEEARRSADSLEHTARLVADQEFKKLKESLKAELVSLSTAWAGRYLKEHLSDADRCHLHRRSLNRLEADL